MHPLLNLFAGKRLKNLFKANGAIDPQTTPSPAAVGKG
jgi:hypothetical protein